MKVHSSLCFLNEINHHFVETHLEMKPYCLRLHAERKESYWDLVLKAHQNLSRIALNRHINMIQQCGMQMKEHPCIIPIIL